MKFVIAPAKKLTENKACLRGDETRPQFFQQAECIAQEMHFYAPHELAHDLKISDRLAWLNKGRWDEWIEGSAPLYPAIELYGGDVYRALDYQSLDQKSKHYVDDKLLIISGAYGLLRPRDCIHPYRLGMGDKIKFQGKKVGIVELWNNILEKSAKDNTQGQPVINLASAEYSCALHLENWAGPVVSRIFKKYSTKTGRYEVFGLSAKKARGLMLRYAAQRGLKEINKLKDFSEEGYHYREEWSSSSEWVFIQD